MTRDEIDSTMPKESSWSVAPVTARDAFVDVVRGVQYGPDALLGAWWWFYAGWVYAHDPKAGHDL